MIPTALHWGTNSVSEPWTAAAVYYISKVHLFVLNEGFLFIWCSTESFAWTRLQLHSKRTRGDELIPTTVRPLREARSREHVLWRPEIVCCTGKNRLLYLSYGDAEYHRSHSQKTLWNVSATRKWIFFLFQVNVTLSWLSGYLKQDRPIVKVIRNVCAGPLVGPYWSLFFQECGLSLICKK